MSKNKVLEPTLSPVGLKLKQARENLSWDIDKAKSLLKISAEKIQIIESDNYPNKIVDVYYKGYIRSLCKHLKLDAKEIFAELTNQGYILDNLMAKNPNLSYNNVRSFQINPKFVVLSIFGVVIISIVTSILKSQPSTAVTSTSDPKINLLSSFEHNKKLSLNDIAAPIEVK